MTHEEMMAPLALADVATSHGWPYRPLFQHLTQRFNYVLNIAETDAGWMASLWYAPDHASPDHLGVIGELGAPGWTRDLTLAAVCGLAADAVEALRRSNVALVIVFTPGARWRAAVRSFCRISKQSGGAA